MAEIRSTLDMVMERATQMASSSTTVSASDDSIKQGMRLAASFMRDETADLQAELTAQPEANRPALKKGMAETLLRNIVLPRETEQINTAEKAMQGLLAAGENDEHLQVIFQEITPILPGYQDHKKKLLTQLEEAFAQQTGGGAAQGLPAQQAKFLEEWERLRAELDSKYGQVLEHHKNLIRQRFA